VSRRCLLATIFGSKLASRSRGTLISTGPAPVGTVLARCADDQAFQRAGDAACQALRHHVATCQCLGWREREPTETLAAAAWAPAHGIAVLCMQGSLARHYPDASLGGIGQLVTAMTATAERWAQP
jgi:hypothetical protein